LTITGTRFKVTIRCKVCAERFVLKGKREKGKIETGFKMCVCGNDQDLDIQFEEM